MTPIFAFDYEVSGTSIIFGAFVLSGPFVAFDSFLSICSFGRRWIISIHHCVTMSETILKYVLKVILVALDRCAIWCERGVWWCTLQWWMWPVFSRRCNSLSGTVGGVFMVSPHRNL